MDWTRICASVPLCIALSGCALLVGDGFLPGVAMHRVSDGAKAACISGTFNPLFGEAKARRMINACVMACRRRGFIENGEATQIDESVFTPDDFGNTPGICRG